MIFTIYFVVISADTFTIITIGMSIKKIRMIRSSTGVLQTGPDIEQEKSIISI